MKKLYLVDVSSMFFRAFFAVPYMKTKEGLPTNALYGFMTMSLKLLRDINPDYMVFCQDRKEPSFRLELYPEYKANRDEMPEDLVSQMPYIQKLTDILGVPNINKLGFEADDIIGTLAKYGKQKGFEVIIVSGDKDFAQLIGTSVTMLDTMKNVHYDVQGVTDKWGVHPEQFKDYLALIGDSSDNIPGVRGVGPKTAQKLLAEYKTLDGIYEHVDEVKGKALKIKLNEHKDMAYLSKKLVTIVEDVDLKFELDDLKLKPVDRDAFKDILEELQFKTFAKKFFDNGNATSAPAKVAKKVQTTVSEVPVSVVKSKSDLKISEVLTWQADDFSQKIEPYSDLRVMDTERGLYFYYDKKLIEAQCDHHQLGEILGKKYVKWHGFDIKNTWQNLNVWRPLAGADSMLASYVVKPQNVDSFEKAYKQCFQEALPDLVPPEELLNYHVQLENALNEDLKRVNGEDVYRNIELPLIPVLYKMEQNGIRLDSDELSQQSKKLSKQIETLESQIHEMADEKFNIASTKQLSAILFEKLELPALKKTKTGFSTNSDVLQKLAKEHPICEYILEFREYSKLRSTYVDALPALVNPETGKIHSTFKQAVTTTGRLSSVNPNLQNIPVRTEQGRLVRKAFVATEGCELLSLDYSQIELRVLAHITGDPGLTAAFNNGLDVHAATAAEIFGVKVGDVSSDQRRSAKAVNFGIAYGQGVYGLAETLGIARGEAKSIIERYFEKFKNIKDYIESTKVQAHEKGYVEMLSGRRRYLDELKSKSPMIRAFGERAAINAPMQGTASDIVKKAMIEVSESVSAPMILQVHDELMFDCPVTEINEQADEVKKIMESSQSLDVPLIANVGHGKNWLDAH